MLNLAIHVGADYIVSADRDLLDLGRSAYFQRLFPSLKVVAPGTLRRELEQGRLLGKEAPGQEQPPQQRARNSGLEP